MKYLDLRKEIIIAGREMVEKNLVIGTWGNISVRLPNKPTAFLITPSGLDYFATKVEDLVVVDLGGNVLAGHRKYSSETQLHRLIYKNRDDIKAIIHNHSPYASALCAAQKPIPPLVEDLVQIVGGGVDVTSYVAGRHHLQLGEAAYRALGPEKFALLLANHGPVACGRSLTEAMVVSQIVEKAAKMYLWAQLVGGAQEIPAEDVWEEREHFLYQYGQKD